MSGMAGARVEGLAVPNGVGRVAPRPARVGLVSGGLGEYWPQFPDLLPQLRRSAPCSSLSRSAATRPCC